MKIEQIKLGLEDALGKLREQKTEVSLLTEVSLFAPKGLTSGVHNVSDWKLDRAIAAVEQALKLVEQMEVYAQ